MARLEIGLLATGLLSGLAPAAPALPIQASNAEAQVRQLWDAAGEAVCSGDWETYRTLWAHSDDSELLHPGQGEWLVGWPAIGAKFEALLSSGARCTLETKSLRVHVSVSGDMAWATALSELTFEGQPTVTMWQTAVAELRDERWVLVHGHASAPQVSE
jgi:ketosteroid isomerase-like protein